MTETPTEPDPPRILVVDEAADLTRPSIMKDPGIRHLLAQGRVSGWHPPPTPVSAQIADGNTWRVVRVGEITP